MTKEAPIKKYRRKRNTIEHCSEFVEFVFFIRDVNARENHATGRNHQKQHAQPTTDGAGVGKECDAKARTTRGKCDKSNAHQPAEWSQFVFTDESPHRIEVGPKDVHGREYRAEQSRHGETESRP